MNGAPTTSNEKAEKEKQKKKDKKERKDRERADREAKEAEEPKEGGTIAPVTTEASARVQLSNSGKATPETPATGADVDSHAGLKSPTTESSTGGRTPTSKRGPRNPFTLFIRMPVPANEGELKEFFGEAKDGIVRVTCPPGFPGKQPKIAYVEFGDEEAMKAGLEKHAEVCKQFLLLITGRLLTLILEIKRRGS